MSADDIERFWRHVNKTDAGCWLWEGPRDAYGGKFRIGAQAHRSHRLAWELEHGRLPEGMKVRRICGVGNCVRPLHMELVTRQGRE